MLKISRNNFGMLCLLLIAILLSGNDYYAQISKANYKILGINVTGNTSADASTIIANSGLSVGSEIEIPGDQTVTAIKRLYALRIFSDIQILIDKQLGDGVYLLIQLSEYPRIEDFIIEGNDEVSDTDIKQNVDFVTGQTFKPSNSYSIISEVKKLYEEEGYLNPKVLVESYSFAKIDTTEDELTATWISKTETENEYTTTYEKDRYVTSRLISKLQKRVLVVCKIDEGDESVIRAISFEGNEFFDDSDLKGTFEETLEAVWWKIWRSGEFQRKEYEEDKEMLVNFYRKNGFRDFEIVSDTLIYSNDNQDLKINLVVNEGLQYKIRNISWEGNTVFDDDILNQRLDLSKGDVYDFEKFSQNLSGNEKQTDVSALYMDDGYLNFRAMPIETKVGTDSIDINIRVLESNRFKVDNVEITGNDRTQDKVIRRELYTIPGDHFSRAMALRSLQQLANLQYFNVEKLYTEGLNPVPATDSTVNLTYKVEEKSSDYLNASVGYSEYWGFSGSIGVTLSNFSIAHPFSQGGGQILNFSWQFGVSNFYRTFSLGFTEPWFMDTPTSVGFDIFDTRQKWYYDMRRTGASIRVGRRLTWPDNFFYVQGTFSFQQNDIIDGGSYYREGDYSQYTLGANISRTDIDNPIFPSRGSKIMLNLGFTGGPFLPGDIDYIKFQLNTDWYKPIYTNRIAMSFSTKIGYVKELNSESRTRIPYFELYYMGGNGMTPATEPLRGYSDRSIYPTNEFGEAVGGFVMTKYTFELKAALALEPMPIYVLAFAEAGNVFESLKKADLFDLRRSVGIGARIMINPIGLVGFDYGYGFDRDLVDPNDAPKWEFHFQFGKGL